MLGAAARGALELCTARLTLAGRGTLAADAAVLQRWRSVAACHHEEVDGGSTTPPSSDALDALAERAALRPGWRAVRRHEQLSASASVEALAAVQHAMQTLDYFPHQTGSSGGNGGSGLPPVLDSPVAGDWSLRRRQAVAPGQRAGTGIEQPAGIAVGDRFVQRVLPAPLPGMRWLVVLAVDEVAAVHSSHTTESESDGRHGASGALGFTVVTTAAHEEIGQHTALLRWASVDGACPDGDGLEQQQRFRIELDSVSVSTFQPHVRLVPLASMFARALQRRAHDLSVRYLQLHLHRAG
jgi:hypothetical protein